MTDHLCPKCGGKTRYRSKLYEGDKKPTGYVCILTPDKCRIRELERLLEAERTAHAETRKALEEADEALIVSMPDDASLDSNGDRRRIWYRGLQAALARSSQRKGTTGASTAREEEK